MEKFELTSNIDDISRMQSVAASDSGEQSKSPVSAHDANPAGQPKRDSILKQISMVDVFDSRLKRLHLFLSQENIERAQRITQKMKENAEVKDKDSQHSSEESDQLANITEESDLEYEEFQTSIRQKIKDIKVTLPSSLTA